MTPISPMDAVALLEGTTPGPWVATERHDYHEILGPRPRATWFGEKDIWAVGYADTDREESEQEANARLIAAAPDLAKDKIALLQLVGVMKAGLEMWSEAVAPSLLAAVAAGYPNEKHMAALDATTAALKQVAEAGL